jgi:hypothetical protein
MSITSVFNNIKAAMEVASKKYGFELLSHELGADHLSDAQTAPAIIWVPKGAQQITPIAGPRSPTAIKLRRPTTPPAPDIAGEAVDTERVGSPGMYASRAEVIEVHIWGKDFAATEELLNHFVACFRVQATGFAFRPMSTDWTLGQEQRSKGYNVCIFTCIVKVPFTFEPQQIAEYPLGLEVDGEFESAG